MKLICHRFKRCEGMNIGDAGRDGACKLIVAEDQVDHEPAVSKGCWNVACHLILAHVQRLEGGI